MANIEKYVFPKSVFQNNLPPAGNNRGSSADLPIGSVLPNKLQRDTAIAPHTTLKSLQLDIAPRHLVKSSAITSYMPAPKETYKIFTLDPEIAVNFAGYNAFALFLASYVYEDPVCWVDKGKDIEDIRETQQRRYLEMFVSLMENYISKDQTTVIVNNLRRLDYEPVYVTINGQMLKTHMERYTEQKVNQLIAFIGDKNRAFGDILACVLCLLIGKQSTDLNVAFFRKVYMAFGGKLGCTNVSEAMISQNFIPDVRACKSAYGIINSYDKVKKFFFLGIVSASRETKRRAPAFQVVLNYLAGTDDSFNIN